MVGVIFKNRKIRVPAREVSFFSMGLIFRTRNTKNLWFKRIPEGNFSLTSFFVFFPFLVLWLDKKKKVVDLRIAGPFQARINTKKRFSSVIEIPINKQNKKIIKFFVGKERFKYN